MSAEKLNDLNGMLMGVENKLMQRALDRSRSELEHASSFINDIAKQGVIDIACDGCGDSGAAGDKD